MKKMRASKWSGWLVAAGSLVLAGVLAISGSPRAEARGPEISKTSVSAPSNPANDGSIARADTDTLDLQLD